MSGIAGDAGMGGMQGAMSGALMGSAVPGIGTAIGALTGGLMGALGGGLSGDQQKRQAAMGAMQVANGNGMAGIPKLLQAASATPDVGNASDWNFQMPDATNLSPLAAMVPPPQAPAPIAPQPTAGGSVNPNMTGQIPTVPQPPAWQQALAASAMTQDMLMKNRPQQVQPGAGPHLFVPQGEKAPTLAAPIKAGPSPLERYVMMMRR